MAEGLLRHFAGDRFEALSAGSKPAGYVHPQAIEAMQELGIDISGQTSKSIQQFLPPEGETPDLIISVCDAAANDCPVFPAKVDRLHWPFEDPAHATGTDAEIQAVFHRVRDEIREQIEEYLSEH